MAKKRLIKVNEARILIFLKTVDKEMKNYNGISIKLGIDYGYVIRLIKSMTHKNWVKKAKNESNKTFIEPAYKCPEMNVLIEAKNA